jgi:hypothetical protein
LDINATSTSIIPQIIGKYSNGEKCYRKGEGNISDWEFECLSVLTKLMYYVFDRDRDYKIFQFHNVKNSLT